ncbi:MAG TPA: ABC transporter, partial [Lachnospiraceae bacterium]|nr:ABC transporter [Lachnospiraceae bacterium]
MFKILKYLKESKAAVAAIIALLVLQAYCDLALPQFTADIVDVGIGQGGIENAVPERMRKETMETLSVYMEETKTLLMDSYRQREDGSYELVQEDEEILSKLNESMEVPMAMLAMSGSGSWKDADFKEALSDYGDMSDSMISQMAIAGVRAEYEALGINTASVQTGYLLRKGGMMLALSVFMMAASILAGLLSARTSARIGRNLRERVFHKVVSFSDTEMDKFSTASLITRSTNDIQQIQMVSVMLLRMVLYAPIVGIGGVIKVVNTRTGMGWIIVVAVCSIMLLVLTLMAVAMPKFKIMQTLVDKLNLVSREILTGIPVIRAFSREKYEEERFDKANKELMKTQLFTNRVMTFMMPVMMMIMNGVTVMIVWFGAMGIDAGNLQVGDMLAFITYTMQIVMAFLMITMISIMLPRAGVAAERIEEVLHMETAIRDKEATMDKCLENVKGIVRFENVSFRYPGADENALEGIDFTANPGETTAVIGSTG